MALPFGLTVIFVNFLFIQNVIGLAVPVEQIRPDSATDTEQLLRGASYDAGAQAISRAGRGVAGSCSAWSRQLRPNYSPRRFSSKLCCANWGDPVSGRASWRGRWPPSAGALGLGSSASAKDVVPVCNSTETALDECLHAPNVASCSGSRSIRMTRCSECRCRKARLNCGDALLRELIVAGGGPKWPVMARSRAVGAAWTCDGRFTVRANGWLNSQIVCDSDHKCVGFAACGYQRKRRS